MNPRAENDNLEYNAEQIQVLEGLEAVRRRPGMYIGSTGKRGLHHLVYEVVDNSIDEALAGFCNQITVTLNKDASVTVKDNGRGIPVDLHRPTGKPAVEVALTILHAGGKFGGKGYKVSGGLHGVGLSVVNALSEWLVVRVRRDGKIYEQRFERGCTASQLQVIGKSTGTGTEIQFLADATIFESIEFEFDILAGRLRELAFLNPGVEITLAVEDGRKELYKFDGGLKDFVSFLNKGKEPLHKVVQIAGKKNDVEVDIALQYHNGYTESVFSYANNIHTHEGGTHEAGFKTALTRVINEYARKTNVLKENDENLQGEDIREGLTAIISVKVIEPQFEGQTKTKLGNTEIRGIVDSILSEGLGQVLEENPSIGKKIIEKVWLQYSA